MGDIGDASSHGDSIRTPYHQTRGPPLLLFFMISFFVRPTLNFLLETKTPMYFNFERQCAPKKCFFWPQLTKKLPFWSVFFQKLASDAQNFAKIRSFMVF